jgi:SAM-dependent methyltransferase
MSWIRATLGDIQGGWALDVATGAGRFIADLRFALSYRRPEAGKVKIVGVDWSRSVAHAPKGGPDVHYLAMNAVRLGFPDSSFDVVCLARALHHMTDATQAQALAEMARVLKPGGRFFVAEMFCDGQTEAQMTDVLIHHWIAAVETAAAGPTARWVHRETFTRGEIVRIVQDLGLRELRLCDVAFPRQEKDALSEWMIKPEEEEIARYVDRFLNGPKLVPGSAALRDRAEELRQRLHIVGYNSATLLVAVGVK